MGRVFKQTFVCFPCRKTARAKSGYSALIPHCTSCSGAMVPVGDKIPSPKNDRAWKLFERDIRDDIAWKWRRYWDYGKKFDTICRPAGVDARCRMPELGV